MANATQLGQPYNPRQFGQPFHQGSFRFDDGKLVQKPQGQVGNPAIAMGIASMAMGALSTWWQSKQAEKFAREQNEYNERMVAKQNEYNAPNSQLERLMASGYTRGQAMNMLYGTPSSAVGTQTAAPTATDLTNNIPDPSLAMANFGNLGLAAMSSGKTQAEANALYQDIIGKEIVNKYMEDNIVKNLRNLDFINDEQQYKNVIANIQAGLAQSTADLQTTAVTSCLMREIVGNMPMMSMTSSELAKYTNYQIQKMFHETSADNENAKYLEDIWKFRNENIDTYKQSERAETEYRQTHARHEQKHDRSDAVEFDYILSHRNRLFGMWDAMYQFNQQHFKLEWKYDNGMLESARTLGHAYAVGLMTDFKTSQAKAHYDNLLINYGVSHFGLQHNAVKDVFGYIGTALGGGAETLGTMGRAGNAWKTLLGPGK